MTAALIRSKSMQSSASVTSWRMKPSLDRLRAASRCLLISSEIPPCATDQLSPILSAQEFCTRGEACFLAGLKRLREEVPPHRSFKVLYSSLYANVTPSFVVDISGQFERRMAALFAYASQYGDAAEGSGLFPSQVEIHERLAAIAGFYGNLIGVKYGEEFVVKEVIAIDDVVSMPVRSI